MQALNPDEKRRSILAHRCNRVSSGGFDRTPLILRWLLTAGRKYVKIRYQFETLSVSFSTLERYMI